MMIMWKRDFYKCFFEYNYLFGGKVVFMNNLNNEIYIMCFFKWIFG